MQKQEIIKLFNELVSYDTQSNPNSNDYPSTENQIYFAEMLANKLVMMNMENVKVDKYCYVTATLPANTNVPLPVIGFIAHMDTSPDSSGRGVIPNIINSYDGKDIILKNNVIISPKEFTQLNNYIGDTIITADGTTLLGADDKAGITEIIMAMSYLINHPEVKHGEIKIAFTPDEEIGAGVDYFDVENFGCDFAYTIDGGELGELSYENFNAAGININITGKSVHPGHAKNVMINAAMIAQDVISAIPKNQTPSTTDGYDGFYHLTNIEANVEKAKLHFIIRDFDKENLKKRKDYIINVIEEINKRYNKDIIHIELKDEYENMYSIVSQNMHIIEKAKSAMIRAGIQPKVLPIRGGTDGSRLSFMNLPCPNIFTGGHNFHGCYEFISVNSMIKAIEVIINICEDNN